jgi:hypothetical protein
MDWVHGLALDTDRIITDNQNNKYTDHFIDQIYEAYDMKYN